MSASGSQGGSQGDSQSIEEEKNNLHEPMTEHDVTEEFG